MFDKEGLGRLSMGGRVSGQMKFFSLRAAQLCAYITTTYVSATDLDLDRQPSVTELRRLLGMVNHIARFAGETLADKTKPSRRQTGHGVLHRKKCCTYNGSLQLLYMPTIAQTEKHVSQQMHHLLAWVQCYFKNRMMAT